MTEIVRAEGLSKRYGRTAVVEKVGFALEEERIYGLIGRNGAGKTTLMRMLTAQLQATEGKIRIFGEHPYENRRVLERICFIKESQQYPDSLKVRDALDIAGAVFPNWDAAFAEQLREEFELPANRIIKKLSRGMLSALGVVTGLASRAPLTLFDEPYLGLDAVARSLFYERLLEDYSLHPRTILLSTHLIDEVSRILEHILLIDKGRLILDTDADELRGSAYTVMGPASKVEAFLAGRKVMSREAIGGYLKATVHERMDAMARSKAGQFGVELSAVSLQELMVQMTGPAVAAKEEEAV
ncbi:ABC transporter ATP-binding protein [Paenibacillus spiritus]|uniref:ABC transporter ATP-binding protein n=1 Tax=Paenibacillus spiritus TaxID=2496557 RepID=A0A5J5FZB3_9BACL|nr:ABC transporter ATP-binding protein [Paenibacillus spiritus]KAA8999651.1 ABC transporter ATP-binding protein [Paenibacillus spiritus]